MRACGRIQVCAGSGLGKRIDLITRIRAEGNRVEMVPCLDLCRRCEGGSFALVGGTMMFAETVEALAQKIIEGGKRPAEEHLS